MKCKVMKCPNRRVHDLEMRGTRVRARTYFKELDEDEIACISRSVYMTDLKVASMDRKQLK